ncbi:DUF2130 domain-containing protein [Ureaplasma ceti]|uniref:DUF2130 domain-containing protein n=1 Tax=Ureaplasma ceti TaxID=3119530 RepID=A0ABP9UC95_9BACT
MAKKVNAFYDKDSKKIIILSDSVTQGDYIELDSLSDFSDYVRAEVDSKYRQNIINEYKNGNEYLNLQKSLTDAQNQSKLDQQKMNELTKTTKLEAEQAFRRSNEYLNLKNSQEKMSVENNDLKLANSKLNIQLQTAEQLALDKYKESSEYKELVQTKEQLKEQLSKIQTETVIKVQEAKTQAINEFRQSTDFMNLKKVETQYFELKAQNNIQQEQFRTKLELALNKQEQQLKETYAQQLSSVQEEHRYELKQKDDEIAELTFKHTKSVKLLGETLEQECFTMYQNSLGQILTDSEFVKDNEVKEGTKADFIFKVYAHDLNDTKIKDNPLLVKAVLEMKTEAADSDDKNRKKNVDHLDKLEKDRIKKGADLAILVTELERQDEFIIKRDPRYPNIIMVRPFGMVSLLTIIRTLALKNKEVAIEAINFKNQQEILDEFEEFKNSILSNSLTYIKNNLDEILSLAQEIEKRALRIYDKAELVLHRHVQTVQNKIENFSIEKKITRRIDELVDTKEPVEAKLTAGSPIELDEDSVKSEKIKIKFA